MPDRETKSLFVFVGDLSADRHMGLVLTRLKELCPDLHVWGVGGPAMKAAGAELLYDCQTFSTFGVVEVLRVLPFLAKLKSNLVKEIEKRSPDAVLLVDFGGFNFQLATAVKKRFKDLPIIYFISPQVWASRPWRIKTAARTVSKMLVIFPFEETLYRSHNVDAHFVGHPYTSSLPSGDDLLDQVAFCKLHGLDPERPIVGIFPGSRGQEIRDHMPVVLQAVEWLSKDKPDAQLVLSKANSSVAKIIDAALSKNGNQDKWSGKLHIVEPGQNYNLMANCGLAWAKSGTTTLEAALFGTPMLIFYRANWLSALLILLFKNVKRVGWPNILAGQQLVPELFQLDCRAERLVKYTCDWLSVPGFRRHTAAQLKEVRSQLGDNNYVDNVALHIKETLAQAPASKLGSDNTHASENMDSQKVPR
jgi:lipid-A-disaccharide synthase